MNEDRAQLVERLQQANNVLITVNNDPTVDQLAACIGFTILLNKLSKHATAVFSGEVPSTLEFLKPEDTLEKNTDSLRDFIIALDKSKADKLRYKVEDTMVKIFITPYKTSISDADLEFSQGDFNVDVVLALGIHEREQVDKAIVGHGRILHDAVVMSVDNKIGNNIGTINWVNEQSSSLCEMLASVAGDLQPESMDAQIATALLTGIVSETERFSNQKTSSSTMEISSKLMAAGADQQLVASKLEPEETTAQPPPPQEEMPTEEEDGAIIIDHSEEEQELPPIEPGEELDPNQIHIDDHGTLKKTVDLVNEIEEQSVDAGRAVNNRGQNSRLIVEPPTMGGTLTANSNPEPLDPSTDPLSSIRGDESVLTHSAEPSSSHGSGQPTKLSDVMSQSPSLSNIISDDKTLEEIEEVVNGSSKVDPASSLSNQDPPQPVEEKTIADIEEAARDAIDDAINQQPDSSPKPIAGLNAQPLDLDMGHGAPNGPDDSSTDNSQITSAAEPPINNGQTQSNSTDDNGAEAPPPVPPPMMPPFNSPSTTSPQ